MCTGGKCGSTCVVNKDRRKGRQCKRHHYFDLAGGRCPTNISNSHHIIIVVFIVAGSNYAHRNLIILTKYIPYYFSQLLVTFRISIHPPTNLSVLIVSTYLVHIHRRKIWMHQIPCLEKRLLHRPKQRTTAPTALLLLKVCLAIISDSQMHHHHHHLHPFRLHPIQML